MRRILRGVVVAALVASVAGCASTGAPDGTSRPRVRQDMITKEQIEQSRGTNPYEVVQSLRSRWLQERGSDSLIGGSSKVQIYFDDRRLGGVETLRSIPLPQVAYIQWFDGTAASGRWGLGHGQGVIYLSSQPLDPDR